MRPNMSFFARLLVAATLAFAGCGDEPISDPAPIDIFDDAGGLDAGQMDSGVEDMNSGVPENCRLEVDNDGDGLFGCDDPDCADAENCRISARCDELASDSSRTPCEADPDCGEGEICWSDSATAEKVCMRRCYAQCGRTCADGETCETLYSGSDEPLRVDALLGAVGVCSSSGAKVAGDPCPGIGCDSGLQCADLFEPAGIGVCLSQCPDGACLNIKGTRATCLTVSNSPSLTSACLITCEPDRTNTGCPASLNCVRTNPNDPSAISVCMPPESACAPASCSSAGAECGAIDSGCGGTVQCGSCGAGEVCSDNICECVPETCASLSASCGSTPDGCGGTLDCGTCGAGEVCNASNACECQPTNSCAQAGAQCGTIDTGCSIEDCGMCPTGEACQADQTCTCTPKTCADLGATCGSVDDGCGTTLDCGTCTGTNEVCSANNSCVCQPTTSCASAGVTCGTIADDGCGNMLNCDLCPGFESCGGGGVPGVCGCTPTNTCFNAGRTCGTIQDGCGNTVSCGTCSSWEFCSAQGSCSTNCDPLTPTSVCGTGRACYYDIGGTECSSIGTGLKDDQCFSASDCREGFSCPDFTCEKLCALNGGFGGCQVNEQCVRPSTWSGAYGVCRPLFP